MKESYDKFLEEIIGRPTQEDFESHLNSGKTDPRIELANMGAKVHDPLYSPKPRYKVILKKPIIEDHHKKIISKIREPIPSAKLLSLGYTEDSQANNWIQSQEFSQEFNQRIDSLKHTKGAFVVQRRPSYGSNVKPFKVWLIVLIGGILGFGYPGFSKYSFSIKNDVTVEGTAGVKNLQNAGEQLKSFNFKDASKSFLDAYNDFSKAGETLNFMGASVSDFIAGLPGAGKLKSARNMVEVGKLLADTGKSMSEAVSAVSKTGSILNPLAGGQGNQQSGGAIIATIGDALAGAQANLKKVKFLLADIDDSIIPDDKKQNFEDLKSKLPAFESLLGNAVNYSGFLENLVGSDKPQKYLLLFENTSELRPTGGFPGTYGVVTFENGNLKDFHVDDIYNPDGQLKRNIIPPKPLQHITPNWGMRDSGWFIDFPTSAVKTEWFFKEELGYDVDGVITISPQIISKFLDVIGPIVVPGHDMVVNGDNFLTTIQSEVEYGKNRVEPKQVLLDMAPQLLLKLYSAKPDKWLEIFKIMNAGLEEKNILMYFNNLYLENFAMENGYSGEVKSVAEDYLMTTISNVKGSKTDAMTDTSIKLETNLKDGSVFHKLSITRKHNGGDSQYGFYNKQNPAYIRVLVPNNSEFIGITGNDTPNFKPILNYGNYRFETDPDLANLESSVYHTPDGVDVYKESGKTEFGFWMIVDPGTEKSIDLEYRVPMSSNVNYKLYIQKQPGAVINNFEFSFTGAGNLKVAGSEPKLNQIGDLYILDDKLDKDLPIVVQFK